MSYKPRTIDIKMPQISGGGFLGLLVAAAVIAIGFTSFYTVDAEERGVVLRFGEYVATTEPGLHFKVPLGVDRVELVKVDPYLYTQEFGFQTAQIRGVRTEYRQDQQMQEASLMLTGDLNIAEVEWIVQFVVTDPRDFLFNVRSQVGTIRDVSEAVMREMVGDRSFDEIIKTNRPEIELRVKEKMQEMLNGYQAGVRITLVKLQDVLPPDKVKDSFNEVNRAKAEQEKMINEARQQYNKVIFRAQGQAERMLNEAKGYATERTNRAQGDAERFLALLREYRLAQRVTKDRIYLETMQEILPKVDRKVVVDPSQRSLLPLLNLGEPLKEKQ